MIIKLDFVKEAKFLFLTFKQKNHYHVIVHISVFILIYTKPMSKKKQIEKNLKLTTKLAKYISDHPEATKKIPSGTSYVAFSVKDKKLNALNAKLIKTLISKGQKVVKAIETSSKGWELNYISN